MGAFAFSRECIRRAKAHGPALLGLAALVPLFAFSPTTAFAESDIDAELATLLACPEGGDCVSGMGIRKAMAKCFEQQPVDKRYAACVYGPIPRWAKGVPGSISAFFGYLPPGARAQFQAATQGTFKLAKLVQAINDAAKAAIDEGANADLVNSTRDQAKSAIVNWGIRKGIADKKGVAASAGWDWAFPALSQAPPYQRPLEVSVTGVKKVPAPGLVNPVGPDAGPGKPQAGPSVSPVFFASGCGMIPAINQSCMMLSDSQVELHAPLGASTYCLNRVVCDRGAKIARDSGGMVIEANSAFYALEAQTRLAATWVKIQDRFKSLRKEMLKRLLKQVGTVAAAETDDCDTLPAVRDAWKKRALKCEGVDGAAAFEEALGSAQSSSALTAICKSKNGGDAAARKAAQDKLRQDARKILRDRCAIEYIKGFPTAPAPDASGYSRQQDLDQLDQVDKYQHAFLKGERGSQCQLQCDPGQADCKENEIALQAIQEIERHDSGSDFRRPIPSTDKLLAEAEARLACEATDVSPRLLGVYQHQLKFFLSGKPDALPSYGHSKAYSDLASVFDRACDFGDSRNAADRAKDAACRQAGGTCPGEGPLGVDELEMLVGSHVAKPTNDPEFDDTYKKVVGCNEKQRTNGGALKDTLESLESACSVVSAVSALPPVMAAAGASGGGAVALGVVNASCVLPPVALAGLKIQEANRLAALRRAMGNQISCGQASDLMAAQSRLHGEIRENLLSAAVQAGLSLGEISALAASAGKGSAKVAEAALEKRIAAAHVRAAELRKAVPELAALSDAELYQISESLESGRPIRSAFEPGAQGEKAFKEASAVFEEQRAANVSLAKKAALAGDPVVIPASPTGPAPGSPPPPSKGIRERIADFIQKRQDDLYQTRALLKDPALPVVTPGNITVRSAVAQLATEFPESTDLVMVDGHFIDPNNLRTNQVARDTAGRSWTVRAVTFDNITGIKTITISDASGVQSQIKTYPTHRPAYHYQLDIQLPGGGMHMVEVDIPTLQSGAPDLAMLERVKTSLAGLPTSHLDSLQIIKVHPNRNIGDLHYQVAYTTFDKAAATGGKYWDRVTHAWRSSMNLFPAGLVNSDLPATFKHELGHLIANKVYGSATPPANWQALFAAEKSAGANGRFVSAYAQNAVEEDFAETLRLYVESDGGARDPATRQMFQARFQLLDGLFGANPQAKIDTVRAEVRAQMVKQGLVIAGTAVTAAATAGGIIYSRSQGSSDLYLDDGGDAGAK